MENVVALINLHDSTNLGLLTDNRPVASTTFLGRYTFIDFAISNVINSGIDKLGILIKDNARSVLKHLGNNTAYLKNPKTGRQNICINEKGLTNQEFNTDIHNIKANDWYFYDNETKYVIVTGINQLMRIDYNECLKEHIASGRKISLIYSKINNGEDETFFGSTQIILNNLGDVQKMEDFTGKAKNFNLSADAYIFNIDKFREIILKSDSISQMFELKDVLKYMVSLGENVHGIKHDGFVYRLNSLKSYFDLSLNLVKNSEYKDLFKKDWPIFTLSHNSRPTYFGDKCEITDCLFANGSKIDGTVKNSVLSRNVTIEEGAIVENCVVFTNTVIKKGVHVKNCIIDKHCTLQNKKVVSGTLKNPLYIHQGAKI